MLTPLDGEVRRTRFMLIARVPVHIASEVREVRTVVKGERSILRQSVPCTDTDDIRKRVERIDIVPRAVRRAEGMRIPAKRAQIERRNAEVWRNLMTHLHICRLLDRRDAVALEDCACRLDDLANHIAKPDTRQIGAIFDCFLQCVPNCLPIHIDKIGNTGICLPRFSQIIRIINSCVVVRQSVDPVLKSSIPVLPELVGSCYWIVKTIIYLKFINLTYLLVQSSSKLIRSNTVLRTVLLNLFLKPRLQICLIGRIIQCCSVK